MARSVYQTPLTLVVWALVISLVIFYLQDSILDDNFEELVEVWVLHVWLSCDCHVTSTCAFIWQVAVGDNARLQQELVYELVQHKDLKMAAHFAVLYKVPKEKQPCEVDAYIAEHGRR